MESKTKPRVLHIVSQERAINYRWFKGAEKLSPNMEICSIDDIKSLPKEQQQREFYGGEIAENMVFVYDYISHSYIPVDQAEKIIDENRYNAIYHIVRLLGGKRIIREYAVEEQGKYRLNSDGSIKTPKFSANVDIEVKKNQGKAATRKVLNEFNGEISKENFEEAKKYCRETGLDREMWIRNLLSGRNPDGTNLIKKIEFNIEQREELNNSLKAAFSLTAMMDVFSLDVNVVEEISVIKRIQERLLFEFE